MLAKLWKKVLLAICIIACIFNIMSKLVNRHSLKENLESANDGETIFSIFQKEEVVETESEPIIEGVMNQESSGNLSNEVTNEAVVIEQTNETTNVVQDTVNIENTDTVESNSVESNTSNEKNDNVFKFSDFQLLFEKNT